ncbi:MAG: cysteine--tRNA ligase, partial [Spirochaetes bacterium]|nr:cysteine--tRNA ligase [Spirochaetota bacterium]
FWRYLKFRGYRVNHAMNITDVDDKTINGSRAEGISLRDYTDRYIKIFFEDLETLNIERAEHNPRATESIDAMIDIIRRLDEKGLVYQKDGSQYFSIAKFETYGRLSRLDSREIKTGLRYDTDEYEKDDVRDFVLWKAAKEGEPSWDTPFGKGRPGWHIECSAMVRSVFGGTIDVHTGGVDLIFPHHENEIAQSEGAYGDRFVRHWIHAEHLLVDGSKMSKSKGNFYTLRDLLDRDYSPRAIRYLLISSHYRKQLNFTLDGLRQAENALARIDNFLVRLGDVRKEGDTDPAVKTSSGEFLEHFVEIMDDDLNISGGIGAFFEYLHLVNSLIDEGRISMADRDAVMDVLRRVDAVFGFIFFSEKKGDLDEGRIQGLIDERQKARKEKNFARADEIRDSLLAEGIVLEDTKEGVRWKLRK